MKLKFGLILLAVTPVILFLYYIYPNILNKTNPNIEPITISSEIGISFVGDIMMASSVESKLKQMGSHYPFEKVRPILITSDVSMGNLETAVTLSGTPKIKEFTFRTSPIYLEGLKWSGINVLSTANNHILDYGSNAMLETLSFLDSYGLKHSGSGKNIEEALKPVIVSRNNKNIAFFSASRVIPSLEWYATDKNPGVAGAYNPQSLLDKVNESRNTNDLTVVYMHWGNEKEIIPDGIQKNLAHQLIDNGADIVVGTHSHTVQGFEFYKGKLIAYSLGNFVFTDYKKDSMILNVQVLDNGEIKARVIPCQIRDFRPIPLTGGIEKEMFYKMLEDRSVNVKIKRGQLMQTSN